MTSSTKPTASTDARTPSRIESLPNDAPIVRCVDDVERHRQRARTQHEREVVRFLERLAGELDTAFVPMRRG